MTGPNDVSLIGSSCSHELVVTELDRCLSIPSIHQQKINDWLTPDPLLNGYSPGSSSRAVFFVSPFRSTQIFSFNPSIIRRQLIPHRHSQRFREITPFLWPFLCRKEMLIDCCCLAGRFSERMRSLSPFVVVVVVAIYSTWLRHLPRSLPVLITN